MSAATGRADSTPVVVAARRTAIGTAGRALAGLEPEDLAAPVLAALLDDLDLDAGAVDDVVLGSSRGPDGALARVAALRAGLGHGVPGMTVDRQCASGLAAIVTASALVRAGHVTAVLAGGVESASRAPGGRARFAPEGLDDPDMGEAAETVAVEAGVTRDRQDAYAARSHERALAAQQHGRLTEEIVGVAGLTRDERPRPLTPQRLARLPAAFVPGGTVTAGNSCGVSDGAAAVVLVPEWLRAERGWPGLRVLATGTSGVDPARAGMGLVPAAESALAGAGLTVDDLGVVEVVEAFAGQVLAALDALGIDEHLCCPDGGALALGHPWGASGAVVMVRLFSRLVRQGLVEESRPYGLAAAAAGGGQGVAMVVQPVAPPGGQRA